MGFEPMTSALPIIYNYKSMFFKSSKTSVSCEFGIANVKFYIVNCLSKFAMLCKF